MLGGEYAYHDGHEDDLVVRVRTLLTKFNQLLNLIPLGMSETRKHPLSFRTSMIASLGSSMQKGPSGDNGRHSNYGDWQCEI